MPGTVNLNPTSVLYDEDGDQVARKCGDISGHQNIPGILALGINDQSETDHVSIDGNGRVRVTPSGGTNLDATYVIITNGTRVSHMAYAINSNTPAEIESSIATLFSVGGQDFTIEINGEEPDSVVSFDTRSATKGYAYGEANPSPKDWWPNTHEKIKVSVDGGALTEVKIGKTHTSFVSVATALQTQIRALVPNGTDVIVEWNSTTFPLRFSAYSGTTGATSSIHFEKGGDDLAKDIRLMSGFDYQEESGTDANQYRIWEVADILSVLSDVTIINQSNHIGIKTVLGGSSATLQVASGGANTALGFPTTLVAGQNGTGNTNMVTNGASTNLRFSIPVPSGRVFFVKKLFILMRSDGANLKEFAGQPELTNGIQIEFRQEGQTKDFVITAKTNGELFMFADEGTVLTDVYDNGNEGVKVVFDFPGGFRLTESVDNAIQAIIRDNLEDEHNQYIYMIAKGWLE